MHEPECPESLDEFMASARMQFDALAAIGVLTQGQASSILHLLQNGETLSGRERAFRHNIVRYLKKEADFVSVFGEMLQIDKLPARSRPKRRRYTTLRRLARKSRHDLPPPPNRNPSVALSMLKRRWAQIFRGSLPPVEKFLFPAIVLSGAVLLAVHSVLTPANISISLEPKAKRVPLDAGARSIPPNPDAAIYPYTISASHAGEAPHDAALNTCYDRYKANREINANGGLSWNQSGGGYYRECLKRLKP
jgi:hypothetical protein